jgi:hypothetical protein
MVIFGEFNEFFVAARTARDIAIRFGDSTRLQRIPGGWAVYVSLNAKAQLDEEASKDRIGGLSDVYESIDPYEDEYHREVIQPLLEEFLEDQDSYALATEDGWFYRDD